jgi:hypothetical protein
LLTAPMDVLHTPSPMFSNPRNVCGVGCVWLCPCPRLQVAFCFLLRACMVRQLNVPPAPLTRPRLCSRPPGTRTQRRTQRRLCAVWPVCLCIDGIVNSQHAQHGAQNELHRPGKCIALILPRVFDPQECASVCFIITFEILSHSLHLSRSSHHHLAPHKSRINRLPFVCTSKPCIVRIEVWGVGVCKLGFNASVGSLATYNRFFTTGTWQIAEIIVGLQKLRRPNVTGIHAS